VPITGITSSSATQQPSSPTQQPSSGLSQGDIAGIAVGGTFGGIILLVAIGFGYKRWQKKPSWVTAGPFIESSDDQVKNTNNV